MIVVAVDVKTLVAEAENAKGVIEFVPQVGDFVGLGEPLFVLFGGAGIIDERKLRMSVVFGPERTMEQDPPLCVSHSGRYRDQGALQGDQ